MKRILFKKLPFYFFGIGTGLLSLIIYHLYDTKDDELKAMQQIPQQVAPSTKIQQLRLQDYELTKPLLLTEVLSEAEDLKDLKRELNLQINELKLNGTINDASVYIRQVNSGEWTSVNNETMYAPGSIIKVAGVITYLKMCEANPKLLEKEFLFEGRRKGVPSQTFNEDPLVAGKKYKAKELLYDMLVKSDNDATLMINESLDLNVFKKLFTDLNIAEPDVHDPNFVIRVSNLSKFMRVLYNATYLNQKNSEFALSLLTQSSFKEEIVSVLPPELKVAHKFGETGTVTEHQLHETAIVYVGQPYLITIMTKGSNVKRLPEALSSLSKIAYERMKGSS